MFTKVDFSRFKPSLLATSTRSGAPSRAMFRTLLEPRGAVVTEGILRFAQDDRT
jgi:hypothetical protein